MQQPGGGGAQTHYGGGASAAQDMTGGGAGPSAMAAAEAGGDQAQLVEAASPISSRPPASAAVNLDELMTLSGAAEDALADRSGGGGSGGNRWPRQETLALLKIRSDMDVAFRDATLKGPLWEDVSRKLLELGYKRSAKKCKEKFENVHKYYKRTKEGRAGRQDGKSYKFFSELEALHGSPAAASTAANVSASPAVHVTSPNPVSIGFGSISNPMPISSYRMTSTIPAMPSQHHQQAQTAAAATMPAMPSSLPPTTAANMDINFSSNSSSSSHGTEDNEDDDDDVEGQPTSRKRKRGSASTSTGTSGSGSTRKMMEFFELLMKQVMQKQESMQQKFLEVIEKREQDRTIREEAWKRQEMARLTREQELVSQERAISASRDAAIVTFLQKITGQTIQLPPPVNVHTAPPPPVPPSVPVATPLSTLPTTQQQPTQTFHQTPQVQQRQQQQVRHQTPQNLQVAVAVPEQQVTPQQENTGGSGGGGGGSFEPASSSRWPKVEVLALIKLRSGLESRYQEAGPKGPLWEEISAGMGRLGYKRNSKRCKEKWENINKYFKKVKESNKKRPEDAKTCPYFHELDALYRKRVIGGGSSGGGGSSSSLGNQNRIEQVQPQQQQQPNPVLDSAAQQSLPVVSQTQGGVVSTDQSQNKIGDHSANVETSNLGLRTNLFGDAAEEAAKKPEDIVKELMEQHHQQQALQQGSHQQQLVVDDYGRIEEADSDNIMDQEEDMDDEDIDEEEDEEMEEERKMDYKIEYQKQNATTGPSSNGGGNGAPSFLAMVQ